MLRTSAGSPLTSRGARPAHALPPPPSPTHTHVRGQPFAGPALHTRSPARQSHSSALPSSSTTATRRPSGPWPRSTSRTPSASRDSPLRAVCGFVLLSIHGDIISLIYHWVYVCRGSTRACIARHVAGRGSASCPRLQAPPRAPWPHLSSNTTSKLGQASTVRPPYVQPSARCVPARVNAMHLTSPRMADARLCVSPAVQVGAGGGPLWACCMAHCGAQGLAGCRAPAAGRSRASAHTTSPPPAACCGLARARPPGRTHAHAHLWRAPPLGLGRPCRHPAA